MMKKRMVRYSVILAGCLLVFTLGVWQITSLLGNVVQKDITGQMSGNAEETAALVGQNLQNITVAVIILGVVLFVGVVGVLFVSEGRRSKTIEKTSLNDALTGLPNWQQLQQFFAKMPSRGGWAYLLLRIPDFRQISNVFGYAVAARMLRDIAKELSALTTEEEIAAHVSEDCFALLLEGGGGQSAQEKRIHQLFHNLRNIALEDQMVTYDYHCSFVGGACHLQDSDQDFSVINRRANAVIELQKSGKEVAWDWYDGRMEEKIVLQDSLMPEIYNALKNDEFIPFFQPQYNVTTGEVVGVEVLARWNHPKHGILLPGVFVPLLEASGCVLELDLIMLEQACKVIQNWLSQGLLPVYLSINISRLNIHRKDFLDRVFSIINRYQVPTNLISLELTEMAIFDNKEKVTSLMRRLKEDKYILTIDDFGSGYSSLNMLHEIPTHIVKLDRKFLLSFGKDERGQTVLKYIVDMLHELGVTLVAEGVETAEQEQMILAAGCKIMQGYYYNHPMSGEDFEKVMFPDL